MKSTLTPVKSIRKHCLDCSGGSVSEVRNCVLTDCPLYSYRFGKNPNRKGIKKGFRTNGQSAEVLSQISSCNGCFSK